MGLIHAAVFTTLDLVGQSPGSPHEDPEGFAFGGWQAPLVDEVAGAQVQAAYTGTDALLLGRRTYDIFAAYWPHRARDEEDSFAALFHRIPKYVASRGTPQLSWTGSELLGPDLGAAVREVRDRHEHVTVVGSLDLLRSLLHERLVDRLDLWLHPLVLGSGRTALGPGIAPADLELLQPPEAGPRGTVHLRYAVTGRTPTTGDMDELDADR